MTDVESDEHDPVEPSNAAATEAKRQV